MIKRIISLMRKDIIGATRDNFMIYIFIAPILLAVMLRMFMPAIENVSISFAVSSEVDIQIIEKLRSYGTVYLFKNEQEVSNRVNRVDDVPGILQKDGQIVVIFEGNENKEVKEIATVIVENIVADTDEAEYLTEILGTKKSLLREYSIIIMFIMFTGFAGLFIGFFIVDEKETGSIRALWVSPMRMTDLIISRSIFALIVQIFNIFIAAFIIVGTGINYLTLLSGILCCSFSGIILGFIVGAFADNQISAITYMKFINFAYITIPIASIFIPNKWHFLLYPFPNYWMFQVFSGIVIDASPKYPLILSCSIVLLSTLIIGLILLKPIKRKLTLV